MVRIIGVGNNVVDKYIDLGKMFPGGNALNVAALARRCGAEASYIGCIGNDAAGSHIYESLKAGGVDVSRIKIIEGDNAYCKVTLVDGDRVFVEETYGVCPNLNFSDDDYE